MSDDQIRLVIPAQPEYGRIARITASSLALRLGFGFAEIEDLRLAVDEMIILLLRADGESGTISLTFTVVPDGLEVDAEAAGGDVPTGATERAADGGRGAAEAAARARFEELVDDIVDAHGVDAGRRSVHLALHRR
ncbi:MAG: hypothetical protein U0Q07_04770 [Acidimicrobiales bacterium]